MSEYREKKEELTEQLKTLQEKAVAEQADLVKELEELEKARQLEIDKKKLESAIKVLDNKELFLDMMEHTRTSCSDDNPRNGYTTDGRGGNVRCVKCAFMRAFELYDREKDNIKKGIADGWYDYAELYRDLDHYISVDMCGGLEISISVDSRDGSWR